MTKSSTIWPVLTWASVVTASAQRPRKSKCSCLVKMMCFLNLGNSRPCLQYFCGVFFWYISFTLSAQTGHVLTSLYRNICIVRICKWNMNIIFEILRVVNMLMIFFFFLKPHCVTFQKRPKMQTRLIMLAGIGDIASPFPRRRRYFWFN